MAGGVESDLLEAWLVGRSLARGLPRPVAEQGGFRVETGSAAELRRWVFPALGPGVASIARSIRDPREIIKVCAPAAVLSEVLPPDWQVEATGWFMRTTLDPPRSELADGFTARVARGAACGEVRIHAGETGPVAGGFWGEGAGGFVYDRIVVDPAFRRRGLGRAVMSLLGRERRTPGLPQLLVATDEGRALYETLGWLVLSPYATATRPGEAAVAR